MIAMADEFRKVEEQYLALRSKLAAGRIKPAEFEAALQRLMLRDEQGRYWALNAQTGKWMVIDGHRWVEATPAGTTGAVRAPLTLPEQRRARQAPGNPGDEFKRAEEQYFALRGRLAAARITQAQFDAGVRELVVRDAQSRTWMLNADTGRWQVYDGRALVEAIPGALPQTGVPPALPEEASARRPNAPTPNRKSRTRALACAGLAVLLLGAIVIIAVVSLALNRGIVPPAPSVLRSPRAAAAVLTSDLR
jgi:hypothetical protein